MQPIEYIVPMVVTDQIAATRDFYRRHFDLKVSFDCEWYVALRSRPGAHGVFEIAFRSPRPGEACCTQGLSFGLQVKDADAELARLRSEGVTIVKDIQDNPWGDRSFVAQDPNGLGLYVFHAIEATPEFRQYAKE
ncbi:MAG: VOC family protein [Deltaproteobacteria bacterium]|nr:VOC family protein [Deltaproteobacteria bacterium]